MLAASAALFPSAPSAKSQQNNLAPVTKREGERERESQREDQKGVGAGGLVKSSNSAG